MFHFRLATNAFPVSSFCVGCGTMWAVLVRTVRLFIRHFCNGTGEAPPKNGWIKYIHPRATAPKKSNWVYGGAKYVLVRGWGRVAGGGELTRYGKTFHVLHILILCEWEFPAWFQSDLSTEPLFMIFFIFFLAQQMVSFLNFHVLFRVRKRKDLRI